MSTADLAAPPPGWFLLDVMRKESRKWDWVALMFDTDPESYPHGHPPPGMRTCWVRVPGKHRNHDAALGAFQAMMATRH